MSPGIFISYSRDDQKQALALLNSGFMAAQSRYFAQRVLKEAVVKPAPGAAAPSAARSGQARVEWAYRLALSRQILAVVADEYDISAQHGQISVRLRKQRADSDGG